jgi:hypothetical protein
VRLLGRAPGFTVVAVLTLALGIGANSAIFTITCEILPKPLPYTNPDEIVLVNENNCRGAGRFQCLSTELRRLACSEPSFARVSRRGAAGPSTTPATPPVEARPNVCAA